MNKHRYAFIKGMDHANKALSNEEVENKYKRRLKEACFAWF